MVYYFDVLDISVNILEVSMWDNIGSKIKVLAKVIAWIGIICSIIGGIVLFVIGLKMRYGGALYVGLGFAAIIGGSLISWISSWFMYGFGEIIHNTEIIRRNISKNENKSDIGSSGLNPSNVSSGSSTGNKSSDTWVCKKCGEKNPHYSTSCKGCGVYRI